MSVIQKIREKYAAVSIAVIALSLVGFILMDALSSRSSLFTGNQTVVGKINGEEINIKDFDADLTDFENNYRQQGMEVNENMRQQLIEMLWNTKVDETLMGNEYNKLGLVYSSADISNALYGDNPPPVLSQQFKNEKTGAYDAEAARTFINGLRKKKSDDPQRQFVEKYLINDLIKNGVKFKYNTLMTGSIYFPKWLHELENTNDNTIASFSYVNVPYSSINDTTIKASDDEIKTYIKNHPKLFEQEASRSISYAVFDASPSATDSASIKASLSSQAEVFRNTNDNEQFLNANGSALVYSSAYVLASKLQVPNADSIKNLNEGAIYGPYLDANNYVIAKMVGKKTLPDSVKCRHILIATKDAQSGQPTLSDSVAKKRVDSVAAVINAGGNFALLAAQLSNDPGSKDKGGEYDFSSQQFTSLAKPFAEFIFYKPKGSKEVIKTDFGWHYIEVMDQKNFETAYNVAYYAKTIDPSAETINTASTAATQFASVCKDVASFEKNCEQKKITPRLADIRENEYNIPGLGNARKLIKWIYDSKKGNVSEPENVGDKYIVAVIKDIKEKGLMEPATARNVVEPILISKKKAKKIIDKIGNSRDLNAIATSFGLQVQRADSIAFSSPFINGIGNEPKVLGSVFNAANNNKVSEALEGSSGVFLIKTETTSMLPSQSLDYITKRMQVEQGSKGNISTKSVESLKKTAKIEDNRIKFY